MIHSITNSVMLEHLYIHEFPFELLPTTLIPYCVILRKDKIIFDSFNTKICLTALFGTFKCNDVLILLGVPHIDNHTLKYCSYNEITNELAARENIHIIAPLERVVSMETAPMRI